MVQDPTRRRFPRSRPISRLLGTAALGLTLSSCSLIEIDSPLTTFKPAGPFAERIDQLFWPVFWIAVVIFVIVQGAILFSVIAFRDRPAFAREEVPE